MDYYLKLEGRFLQGLKILGLQMTQDLFIKKLKNDAGSSQCLVLEHFEHDRPEVLKREINMYELQWFSYFMFRALSGLHKQGVVHRDVKPGNFLFSREVNKGYLIDFNLAMDLHQKYGTTGFGCIHFGVRSLEELGLSWRVFYPKFGAADPKAGVWFWCIKFADSPAGFCFKIDAFLGWRMVFFLCS